MALISSGLNSVILLYVFKHMSKELDHLAQSFIQIEGLCMNTLVNMYNMTEHGYEMIKIV